MEVETDTITDQQYTVGSNSNGDVSTGSIIRSNAIHFSGVDDMNTADIEKYLVTYYNKPFQIEWIDDSSLNIIYDDPEDAFQSLVAVTDPKEFEAPEPIAPEQQRQTKPHPSHPEANLRARFAFETDQKANGSRLRSRYYLLHGEPTRKEDLTRFGTRRSKPMKYGFKDRDIISKSRREDRAGDLFPTKAPQVPLDSIDVDMDLLPNKAPKRGRRGGSNKGKNRRNKNKPDLFADKLGSKTSTKDETNSGNIINDPPAPPTSIFQNMDY